MNNRQLRQKCARLDRFLRASVDPRTLVPLDVFIKSGGRVEDLKRAKIIRLEDINVDDIK